MRFIITIFASLIFATAAAGETTKHIEAYKAYNAALDAGDYAEAAKQAEAAWRAAETELGDNQTTAVLAYNFASLIYNYRPADAIEPLERVIVMTGERNEIFGPESAIVMLRLVEASSDKDNRTKRIKLEETLTNSPPTDRNLLYARAWTYLGIIRLQQRRYNSAVKAFDNAIISFEAVKETVAPREFTSALIASGISRVGGTRRKDEELLEAYDQFDRAIALFPPQQSIAMFDELLANAMAWRAAAYAAAATDNNYRPGSRRKSDDYPDEGSPSRVKWVTPRPESEDCEFAWDKRPLPEFPSSDANHGYIGGVLVGYDLDGLGVGNAVLLAEVPALSEFGENALAAVKKWTLSAPPPKECIKDNLATFQFVLSP